VEQVLRRLLSAVIATVVILVSFVLVESLANANFTVVTVQSQSVSQYQSTIIESFLVIVVNFVLYTILDHCVSFERRKSSTSQEASYMFYSALAAVCNSVIVVIIAHWIADKPVNGLVDWYSDGGLISEVCFLMLSNMVVTPLLFLFDIWHICVTIPSRWFVNRWTTRRTQDELNHLYMGPQFSIATRVADLIKTVFLSFAFAPIIPLAPLCGCIGVSISYLADRYHLFRLARRPHFYHERIMTGTVHYTSYFLAPVPLIGLMLLRPPNRLSPAFFASCLADVVSLWNGWDHILVSLGAIVIVILISVVVAQALLLCCSRCCRHCRRSSTTDQDAEPMLAEEAVYWDVQWKFPVQYQEANPVYKMLHEDVNPACLSADEASGAVGARGGRKLAEFLGDKDFLDRLFTFLVSEADQALTLGRKSPPMTQEIEKIASAAAEVQHMRTQSPADLETSP
jgi:hypothetical protein